MHKDFHPSPDLFTSGCGKPFYDGFMWWCQQVLPLAYDDSLSYYEVLCKLKEVLSELIKYVNTIDDTILQGAYEHMDAKIAELKRYINVRDSEINYKLYQEVERINKLIDVNYDLLNQKIDNVNQTINAKYDREIAEIRKYVNDIIQDVKTMVTGYYKQLTAQIALINDIEIPRIDTKIDAVIGAYQGANKTLKSELTILINDTANELERMISGITVHQVMLFNPVNWKTQDIQTVVFDMMYNLKAWGFKAYEFDNIPFMTAELYDKQKRSAWDYDYLGKWYYREKPEVYDIIDREFAKKKREVDRLVCALAVRQKKLEREVFLSTQAYNPFTGERERVSRILPWFAYMMAWDTMTTEEFDSKGIHAHIFDDLGVTAFQYDWHGKSYYRMYPAWEALTAELYDAKKIIAEIFDGIGISAYDYDWYGKRLLQQFPPDYEYPGMPNYYIDFDVDAIDHDTGRYPVLEYNVPFQVSFQLDETLNPWEPPFRRENYNYGK